MTRLLLLLFSCSMLGIVAGQNTTDRLIPFCENGLWGYMSEEKEVVIKAQYDRTYFFDLYLGNSSLPNARVQRNGKFGVLNQAGQMIIPIKYDSISEHTILTSLGNYGEIYHRGKKRYFSDDGRVKRKHDGVRGWVCGGVLMYDFMFSSQTTFVEVDSTNNNYIYRPLVIEEKNGQLIDRRDTVHLRLDSIISSNQNNTVIMYRNDGKINICQSVGNDVKVPLSICMGFRYDEVSFVRGYPGVPVLRGAYEKILKVRQGDKWGLLDLTVSFSKGIRIDYETSWYLLPLNYRQIIDREHGYYLVEYEEGKLGYVKPFGKWNFMTGREGSIVEYWDNE